MEELLLKYRYYYNIHPIPLTAASIPAKIIAFAISPIAFKVIGNFVSLITILILSHTVFSLILSKKS